MNTIIIREARPDDAAQIIAYLKKVGAETDNLTFGEEGLPITVAEEKNYIHAVQNDLHSVMYVALENDKVIGTAALNGLPRRMSHRSELSISVQKDKWNCKIGSSLLERLIHYAKNYNIELIHLEVREDNKNAIHLYEKFGFQKIGISPAFFKIGNDYIDFLLMYLDLRKSQNCQS